MQAAVRTGSIFWGPNFGFSSSHPKPKLVQSTHVLLKVLSASINPVDYKLSQPFGGKVYGLDVCGQVIEVGESNKDRFRVGDVVFGLSNVSGSMAEFYIVHGHEITHLPSNDWLTPTQAAALPVAFLTAVTAWQRVGLLPKSNKDTATQTLPTELPVAPESMVVIGASGGCGMAAAQLARGWGVKRIIGICSAKNAAWVQEVCGVTEVLDYNDERAMKEFADANEGMIDHIYDSVSSGHEGEDYSKWSLPLLKKDTGSYVALNGGIWTFLGFLFGGGRGFRDKRQTLHLTTGVTPHDLELVLDLLKKSTLKPEVEVVQFTEQGCVSGLDKLRSRRTKGKIVFNIVESPDLARESND